MADVCQSAPRSKKAYWTKNAKESSDDSESFVPGVTVKGNRRPVRMQGRKTKEIKAKIPVKQPVIENIVSKNSSHELSESLDESSVLSRRPGRGPRQVTLKDLTHVDKKRIADLIKELAKVGDEREKAVGQLHQERTQFEKQVLQLVEQQEKILNEREDIQGKLFQCQDLLTKYQNKILEKQEEINTSFREMSNTPPENVLSEYSLSQRSLSVENLSLYDLPPHAQANNEPPPRWQANNLAPTDPKSVYLMNDPIHNGQTKNDPPPHRQTNNFNTTDPESISLIFDSHGDTHYLEKPTKYLVSPRELNAEPKSNLPRPVPMHPNMELPADILPSGIKADFTKPVHSYAKMDSLSDILLSDDDSDQHGILPAHSNEQSNEKDGDAQFILNSKMHKDEKKKCGHSKSSEQTRCQVSQPCRPNSYKKNNQSKFKKTFVTRSQKSQARKKESKKMLKAYWSAPGREPGSVRDLHPRGTTMSCSVYSRCKTERIKVHDVQARGATLLGKPVSLMEKVSWLDPKRHQINVHRMGSGAGAKPAPKDSTKRKKEPVRRKLIQRSRSQSPDQEGENINGYSWESHGKHPSPSRYRNVIHPSEMYPARPFTSKIDKEIALQRTFTERDILSTIICQSAAEHGPEGAKDGYRDQVPALKAFREPIMSSTQKSSEINQCISGSQDENFHSLVPDSSPRSSRLSEMEMPLHGAHMKDRDSSRSKVGFKDKHLEVEYENAKMHSPHLPSVSAVFGDKMFMNQYKKLSQTDRKRELLKQRENLLDEQKRLKMILRTQEQQLRTKQDQLHKQQVLQKERLAYFEKNGKFPLGRPHTDFYNDIEENQENIPLERPRVEEVVGSQTSNQNKVRIPSPKVSQVQTYGDIGDDGSLFGGEVKKLDFDRPVDDGIEEEPVMHDLSPETRSRTSIGTSPIHESRQQRLLQSIATSPIRVEQSRNSFHTPTRVVDAATSVSHINMSPRSQKSTESVEDLILGRNFQGNLPLSSNRGRSHQSPAQTGPRTPGDKTLSVVEIVNSLDQSPSWAGSNHGNKSPTNKRYGTPPIHNTSIQEDLGEDEESRVLEDVFFLRG